MKETETEAKAFATISKKIDLRLIYRVKGRDKLFVPVSPVNKGGMVGMCEFMGVNTISVHQNAIECLNNFTFYANSGNGVTMGQAFDNIEALDNETTLGLKGMLAESLMNTICPDFDQNYFKPYHAIRFMNWYFEIKEKINLQP